MNSTSETVSTNTGTVAIEPMRSTSIECRCRHSIRSIQLLFTKEIQMKTYNYEPSSAIKTFKLQFTNLN